MPCMHLWYLIWNHVYLMYALPDPSMRSYMSHMHLWHLIWDHVCIMYASDIWDHVYIMNISMTSDMRYTQHVCIFSFLRIVQKKTECILATIDVFLVWRENGRKRRKMDRWFFRWFPSASIGIPAQCYVGTQELLAKSPHHRTCGFSVLSIWISIQATPIKMSSQISYFERQM